MIPEVSVPVSPSPTPIRTSSQCLNCIIAVQASKKACPTVRGIGRSRRTRKLRYRPPRWANRSRKAPTLTANGWHYQSFGQSSEGWIAPSLMSRVFNIHTWVKRLSKAYPITQLAVEHVKFDMQLMENPEISGVEYQQGTLYEAELWEYLLEKFGRKCFYCGAKNVPLEKEHILPKGKGGTNRASNLTVACRPCNIKKGNKHPDELTGDFGKRVQSALRAAKKPLKDAASVNTIRWKIVETLKSDRRTCHLWHRRQNEVASQTSRLTENALLRRSVRRVCPEVASIPCLGSRYSCGRIRSPRRFRSVPNQTDGSRLQAPLHSHREP